MARWSSLKWGDIKSRMVLGSLVANLGGACFVFVYLEFIARFQPNWEPFTVGLDAMLAAVAVLASALVHERVIGCQYQKATAWIHEKRPPTEAEARATLTLPWRSTAVSVVSWVAGATIFGALVWFQQTSRLFAAQVAITTLLGGLVTTALAYFLMERATAPLIPLTLQSESPTQSASLGIRPRLILAWALGSGIPLLALAFLPLHARAAAVSGLATPSISGAVIIMSLAATIVGLVLTTAVARSVAVPLDHLREGLRQVGLGHLDTVVNVEDGGEIGLLQSGFNRMVAGLRERERLHDLFGRHVGVQVAQRALEEASGLGGEQHEVSALFVDLVGSTALAEVLPPGEVVATLNAFFGAVVAVVGDEGGWVNKFEGDGALCVFGAPGRQPDHAARALRAARRLDRALRSLECEHPGLVAGIGVSSGVVVAGNVGTETRYEYTVVGRAVNEAARVTEIAKGRSGRVLATASTLDRARSEAPRWSPLGTVALRGSSQPTNIYEPVIKVTTE